MNRRIVSWICLLLSLAILAGCAAQPSVQTTTTDTASVNTGNSSTTPASTAPEPVTLHLFHQKQEAQETFAKIIEEFTKKYPHITIEQEIVTNDPSAVLKSRIATDEIPDIFQAGLEVIDISKGGYMTDLTSEAFLKNINEAAVQSPSFTDSDGKTWALPIDGSCIGIFYNKDIFAKYNLTPPQTLSEFENVVKTLRDNGVTPFALGFKDAWTIKTTSICAFSPAVYGRYPSWDVDKSAGTVSFAVTPEWSSSLELLKKIYESGDTKTAFDTDYNGACSMIARGEAAMMAQGLWALEPIRDINPDVNIGIMALPVSENPEDTKLHQFPDFSLSISSQSKYQEECKLFFEFLTTTEIAELWSNTAKLFSAVKGVSVDFDPVAADVNALITAGQVCPQADRGWPTAFHAEFEAALPSYILGKSGLDGIMKDLDSAWDTAKAASQG